MLCWPCSRPSRMGNAVSQETGAPITSQPTPTMADVIRERKKKAGGVALGTLRRRIANAARPDRSKHDRGCEHARYIRSVVSGWRLPEVFALCHELEAGAALRALGAQAATAREPAATLARDLTTAANNGWWCDVQLVGAGYCIPAHRAILAARCTYFRELLARHPSSAWVVPLEGAGASLSRDEMETVVRALYGSCLIDKPWNEENLEHGVDHQYNDDTEYPCMPAGSEGAILRRLGAVLGFNCDALERDMLYLLDSGSYSDARLVFRLGGGSGAAYGFRTALELPCHRVLLAARSRYFRSMMSVRVASGPNGVAFCVDDTVLPARVARALLHAVYTDQVDLSLVSRSVSPPESTNSSTSTHSPWANMGARTANSTKALHDKLDDAFALYEIARFLEMPIVAAGCEDAIVSLLSPHTLGHVVRWSAAHHASHWVRRQAMRYLMDEFPSCLGDPAAVSLSPYVVSEALASPFLQASEGQVLRALVKWAERVVQSKADEKEKQPSRCAVASVGRGVRGARGVRRGAGEEGVGDVLAPLLPLVRTVNIMGGGGADADYLTQLSRRGVVPASLARVPTEEETLDAWLGRNHRPPPRCFQPYLDELKALLEDQSVPEEEIQRVRRVRCRIPDTLYMVSGGASPAPPAVPLGPRTVAALQARANALLAAHAARSPLTTRTAQDTQHAVHVQIALRVVREMSLPDSCADIALSGLEWDGATPWPMACCRSAASATNSLRRASASSLPNATAQASTEPQPPCGLPDIALAPNANTHLLTARDCMRAAHATCGRPMLQLDLGDGATHAPRPGSRAQRAAQLMDRERAPTRSDLAQAAAAAAAALPARAQRDNEFREDIELNVVRAYSAFGSNGSRALHAASTGCSTLPTHFRNDTSSTTGVSPWHPLRSTAQPLALSRSHTPRPDLYRLEANASGYSSSSSRNPSPSNYA